MLPQSTLVYLTFLLLASTETVLGREQWLERDGKAVRLYPRRFGQEQPAVIGKIGSACPGQVCGVLSGQAITPLLAAQPECSQQDMADAIIDASKQFDAATQANMIALAKEYRQAEKNTPPDFTVNPPALRNSVFCQKAPKNAELNGLVQAQDPANDPNLFFDPATKATVKKGAQANTEPFGGAAAAPVAATTKASASATSVVAGTVLLAEATTAPATCVTAVTITVTGTAPAVTESGVPTITVGGATSAASAGSPLPTGVDFGSCTPPEIEFGVGFDNRKETSFQPTDKASFNHGSAQNIDIITQFICDTLTNSCKANQAAKDLCASAQSAASAATPVKTGIQADTFNKFFGIDTQFANVQPFDDQGRPIGTTGLATTADSTAAASTSLVGAASSTATLAASNTVVTTPPAATTAASAGGIGNFGKCTVPQILFATGLDGRKETAFAPVDTTSYNHGSAQNIDIITQFICDTLTNTCGADATAKSTCAKAEAAASAAAKGTGAQADAFNNAFGITTKFAAVPEVDNQGNVVGATNLTPATTAAASAPAATSTSSSTSTGSTAATAGNLQTFTGTLGGVVPPTVTSTGNGQFQVTGNASFNSQQSAVLRSCDVQNNQCANAANASGNKNGFTVAACNAQQAQCISNAGN